MPQKLDFITPTFMTVFDLFLSDPMAEHHEREVIRETDVSKGSANRILRELAGLGFLIRERRGRMVFYRLDAENPVVRQFKVLVNVYALSSLLSHLKRHTRRVVLFGSCAQGVDVKESDIDLFILSSEKEAVRGIVGDFNQEEGRRVSPIVVDFNEFARLKREDRPLYENVERGIVLWTAE